jgi:hypothetical protein
MALHAGVNDVRSLAPGVYFEAELGTANTTPGAVGKVVVTR